MLLKHFTRPRETSDDKTQKKNVAEGMTTQKNGSPPTNTLEAYLLGNQKQTNCPKLQDTEEQLVIQDTARWRVKNAIGCTSVSESGNKGPACVVFLEPGLTRHLERH